MYEDKLKEIGFSDKESSIYLSLLEKGGAGAALISKVTGINRTTVYSVLKELIEKGMVAEIIEGNGRIFTAKTPSELQDILTEEETKLTKKKTLLNELVKELDKLPQSKNYSVPKIRFINARELNNFIMKQTPIWFENGQKYDATWWGFQDYTFPEQYKEWAKYHWEIAPKNLKMKIFTNREDTKTSIAKEKIENREVRFVKNNKYSATIAVMGDYIIMVMTNQEPHYMVQIFDAVMAHNLRESFKIMWENYK